MRRVIRFYDDQLPNREFSSTFPTYSSIANSWSDYKLQSQLNLVVKWLYPSPDDEFSKLDKGLINKFRVNENLRRKVFHVTLRIMYLFGYTITLDGSDVKQIRPILREEKDLIIGLLNKSNNKHITRILNFLTTIRMKKLSELFFLMICRTLESSPEFKYQIDGSDLLSVWVKTQPYLENYGKEEFESVDEESIPDAWDS